jgi:hypothetical protein
MYRVRFAVCTVFVLRCLELAILPGWWVENPQQRLMSPHREPSPVHYVTKLPVIAAYLLGRRCCWARENLSWDNRRVKILVCELLWYLYFLREPVPNSIFTYPRPKLIHLQINLSLHLFLGPGCENLKTNRECYEYWR